MNTPTTNTAMDEGQMRQALFDLGMPPRQLAWELEHGGLNLAELLAQCQQRVDATKAHAERYRAERAAAPAPTPSAATPPPQFDGAAEIYDRRASRRNPPGHAAAAAKGSLDAATIFARREADRQAASDSQR
jgi:hypothetical protein